MRNQTSHSDTRDLDYTRRLIRVQTSGWKRFVDVQAPYRWNLRRLHLGLTLEIGCGIGRNLLHLQGQAIGIDHNGYSVEVCRSRNLTAFTPDGFKQSSYAREERFDSILVSHVAEHMRDDEVVSLVRIAFDISVQGASHHSGTPQELGYRSDKTHVMFMDFSKLHAILRELGFAEERSRSFPLPRLFGRLFLYNEFVVVGYRET